MSFYGKIYEQTFTGSMYGSGACVFAVWSYVIANARPPGKIELNPRMLASTIGAPLEEIRKAIDLLCAPDPESRTKEHKGCRLIREGEFLYLVPTFARYRIGTEEERKAAQNARKQRSRDSKKNGHTTPRLTSPEAPAERAQNQD